MTADDVNVYMMQVSNELVEDGTSPTNIAAAMMVTALLLYANTLSKQDYLEVIDGIFTKAHRFIEKRTTNLH